MNRKMRICCVCHKEYPYCPRCPEDKNKEPWHFVYCSKECKDIDTILIKYSNGSITAVEAKEKLDRLDASNKVASESYKRAKSNIYSEAKKSTSKSKVVEEKTDVESENVIKKPVKKVVKKDVE